MAGGRYVGSMSFELVVIGGGNMGAALVGGLLAKQVVAPESLAICEVVAARRDELSSSFPGVTVTEGVPPCAAAVLAVKPAAAADAAAAAAAAGARRLLSIAAGARIAALESAAGDGVAVVRSMPNTPALVGEGASAYAGGSSATSADLEWAGTILRAVGTAVAVDEADLDAVTALSGSGPAYLYLVAEALIEGAVANGLDAELATALTTQLFVGSAKLLAERGDAAALRAMVTSPGGTTAAGLAALAERDLRGAVGAAVTAAADRSRELAG